MWLFALGIIWPHSDNPVYQDVRFVSGQESISPRRGFSGVRHKLASGFVYAPIAALPFFHRALAPTAVKFAKGRVLRDLLYNLVSEPPPASTNKLGASQLIF